eukprot:scaffold7418_cov31-Tisochrysis_lutea.AAC.5
MPWTLGSNLSPTYGKAKPHATQLRCSQQLTVSRGTLRCRIRASNSSVSRHLFGRERVEMSTL